MLNSWIRCETVYERSPWIPTAASRNAITANVPITRTCTARDAVLSDTISRIVRMFEMGCSGSARCTTLRTAGSNAAGDALAAEYRMTRSFGIYPMKLPSPTCLYER